MASEILGIFPSGLIIKSAITSALEDLRAQPYLLDYVFASLPVDDLTKDLYGQLEVDKAKEWFLATQIRVFHNVSIDAVKLPCISIKLLSANEAETTLSDTHYVPHEDSNIAWPPLTDQFDPLNYDYVSGLMTVPESVSKKLWISKGQVVVDVLGGTHIVLETLTDNSFYIEKGLRVDFHNATIRGQKPAYIASLESVNYRETCLLGCHVQGESYLLIYLVSILSFILLAYKESKLEARGFERSVFNLTDEIRNESFEKELVFSRYIQLQGVCRNSWPKNIVQKITGVHSQIVLPNQSLYPNDPKGANQADVIGEVDEDQIVVPGIDFLGGK